MSSTIVAYILVGIACTESDFLVETGSEWRCHRGHPRRDEDDRFCPKEGAPYSMHKCKTPTPAFQAVCNGWLTAEERSRYKERYDSMFFDMIAKEPDGMGLFRAERFQPMDRDGTAFVLGTKVAKLAPTIGSNAPFPFVLEDPVRDDLIRKVAERYGIDPKRPIQSFLCLYFT